jgi:methylated-DNA-[protein]-cysteine S-methyltransferase
MTESEHTVPIRTRGGAFRATFSSGGLRRLQFPTGTRSTAPETPADPRARQLAEELDAYLRGERQVFTIPLDPRGTPFQLRVWEELGRIPYGETRSYLEVATAIGSPDRVRAVGAANGANPTPILVPCHRVIGADGSLVGFGGGLDWKRRLLDVERPQLSLVLD